MNCNLFDFSVPGNQCDYVRFQSGFNWAVPHILIPNIWRCTPIGRSPCPVGDYKVVFDRTWEAVKGHSGAARGTEHLTINIPSLGPETMASNTVWGDY